MNRLESPNRLRGFLAKVSVNGDSRTGLQMKVQKRLEGSNGISAIPHSHDHTRYGVSLLNAYSPTDHLLCLSNAQRPRRSRSIATQSTFIDRLDLSVKPRRSGFASH